MYAKVLVPIDGGATGDAALREAVALARVAGSRLRLLHVLDRYAHASGFEPAAVYCDQVLPRERGAAGERLERACAIAAAAGVQADAELIDSPVVEIAQSICSAAQVWGADLIVLGTHGRRGVDRLLLGSRAEAVVRRSTVPVLLVHGDAADPACAADAGAEARADWTR